MVCNFTDSYKRHSVHTSLLAVDNLGPNQGEDLSRIWGGIHPPADDMPGRHIGDLVGPAAFHFAERYFTGTASP